MKQTKVRAWPGQATCVAGHEVEVAFCLPDYGDAPTLYQCRVSGDLFSVSPDAEQYVGPAWDVRRMTQQCPACGEGLEFAMAYPDNFRCPVCGQISRHEWDQSRYPDESLSIVIDCWDPYQVDER